MGNCCINDSIEHSNFIKLIDKNMSSINPWEVLSLRRKLKKYKTVGIA